ncbi:MAG: LuxR C-terminal-related transcriptional regulator [Brevinematales bacterium]
MRHFLLIYYAVAVFSGLVGIAVVALMVFQNLRKLSLVYGVFVGAFSFLLVNILCQYYGYFILGEVETPEKLWWMTLLIFVSKSLFLLGFGLVMVFLFSDRWWGDVIGGIEFFFAITGLIVAFVFALLGFSSERLRLLLFFDQWVWGILLVVFLGSTILFLWFRTLSDVPTLLSQIIRLLLGLTLVFLPLFLVDNLWELFQVKLGLLPRCFNFSPLYYVIWNFLTFCYMVRFLAEKSLWLSELVRPIPSCVGGMSFSRREREIISLLLRGEDNATIAGKLYISEHTVRNYISKLYEKTFTSNRVQLVQKLMQEIEKEMKKS